MSDLTLSDLNSGMCRWPFGNPEDKEFHFCGDLCDHSLPYCPTHMVKAQAPSRKSKS